VVDKKKSLEFNLKKEHKTYYKKKFDDGQNNMNLCKKMKMTIDLDMNVLKGVFKTNVPAGSLKAGNCKTWLGTRYTDRLAGHIVKQMGDHFGDFMPALYEGSFAEKIKKFAGSDQAVLRNFAFKVFDIENNNKITLDNLFTFMEIFKKNKRIYGAGEMKND
jgi:Ca2+-binding EF-hand superfamily protein